MDSILYEFLEKLGLDGEERLLYSLLSKTGQMTILKLSEHSGINRTRIYRLAEKLQKQGLIEEVIDEHRKYIRAVATDHLDLLIRTEEEKAKKLRTLFPKVIGLFSEINTVSQPGTKVLFYRGREGIRQQVWNTLRTRGELLGYSYRPLIELIGDYYIKWYEEWTRRKLRMRDIYSDEYIESKKKLKEEFIYSFDFPKNNIDSRYIPSKILDITHQIDIYNGVVSYYSWHEGEVFGVEIYNEKIAKMQKQLFEIVWKMSKKSK